MKAADLRARGDRELAEKILEDRLVRDAIERIEREEEESPKRVRRQLLASALRLTEKMMPDVHATVELCREKLGIEIPLEIYVYPSADFNAACVKPEEGKLFILLSSSLLEGFPKGERRFVIGHELGHHLYGHHDIPIGLILRGQERPPRELALRLFAWSRYAELSADRAGAACTESADNVARALFRLASGVRLPLDGVNIDEFAAQVEDIRLEHEEPGQGAPMADWFATHPFSPLRLRAMQLFFASELADPAGYSVAKLEAGVQELLSLMEPSYLKEKSEEAEIARRLLFAAAIAVADKKDGIGEAEVKAFEGLFGEGSFSPQLDLQSIEASLEERTREAGEMLSHPRRIQVLRDLCFIAKADGTVSDDEKSVIESVAKQLEVAPEIIGENCTN